MKPQTDAYGKYADAHMRELIQRYHPAVLWNDIDYPKSGHPLDIMAEYYNAVPDGVIDDRFGVKHSDFQSPEYETLDKISPTKWEECPGLGRSFGYNRAEGEAETIAPPDLIYLLVDIVSKNGNLLLDVGPEANGIIPPVQLTRLQALGHGSTKTAKPSTALIPGNAPPAKPPKASISASPKKIPLSAPRSSANRSPPPSPSSPSPRNPAHRSSCSAPSKMA